jgi:hypothetical protein
MPASRHQNHTTSPSAGWRRRRKRNPRPPHPASTFVTMRNAPLIEAGRPIYAADLHFGKTEIFSAKGWTKAPNRASATFAFQFTRLKFNAADATISEAGTAARIRLATLEREVRGAIDDPSGIEINTVRAIQESLLSFVRQRSSPALRVTFEPNFAGCGFLNPCVGDILIGHELYEVKAGDRRFRSTDLRQLMTYCALNYAAGTCTVTKAGCVNPRRGTYFVLELDAIAYELAGKSSSELFSDIIYHVSSGGVSR